MQEVPQCLKDVRDLRLKICKQWKKGAGFVSTMPVSCHFAAVTEEFMKVARDTSLGGAQVDSNAYKLALCVWVAAVLTALLHVRGKDSFIMVQLLCTWTPGIRDMAGCGY